jgi:metal-responsive CopG/Arc/MetJ family transcriptional regulator
MSTQTFNIALPEELVKKVDELAKQEYSNRSEFIRDALKAYIKNAERWEELFSYGKSVVKGLKLKDESDVDKIVFEYRHGKKSS